MRVACAEAEGGDFGFGRAIGEVFDVRDHAGVVGEVGEQAVDLERSDPSKDHHHPQAGERDGAAEQWSGRGLTGLAPDNEEPDRGDRGQEWDDWEPRHAQEQD